MGDITIANTFVDGTAPTGDQISQNFFDELGGDNSLETINGGLENANRLASWKIKKEHIQPGTFTGGGTTGSTANLDYMQELFTGYDPDNAQATVDPVQAYLPIPGANRTFHLEKSYSIVLIMWNVMWASDAGTSAYPAHIRLWANGVFPQTPRRRLGQAIEPALEGHVQRRVGKWRDRVYSGHWLWTNPPVGWHTVGLRIASRAHHCRVRVRQLSVAWFL